VSQTFFPIDPVEVAVGATLAWTDVDISAHIPVNATDVILHIVNTNAPTQYAIGLRKNGSTSNTYQNMHEINHFWAAIGVDANRIFEAYVGSTTDQDIYVVGYTMSGVTFLTNGAVKTPATGAWNDIDCSAEAPNAVGLIFEVIGHASIFYDTGLRKNGSTDNHLGEHIGHTCFGAIIGCDDSQICEGYRESFWQYFALVGYITDGATFNTNATDVSLSVPPYSEWTDLPALPATAVMGFIEVNCVTTGANYYYGLRENGSAENIYYTAAAHNWGLVECDANRIIEGKILTNDLDFHVVGYATAPAVVEGSASGSGIGLAEATARLDVFGQASASGVGIGSGDAFLDVIAQAEGNGVGIGSGDALLDVIAQAQASGVGSGMADALLEVLAEAQASGVGTGQVIDAYLIRCFLTRVNRARLEPIRLTPSRLTPSRVSPSRVKASRLNPSRMAPSRIRPSRIDASRLEASKVETIRCHRID